MVIIKSCCCWRSLRKASIAVAIYSYLYFMLSVVTLSLFVYEERRYLAGEIENPETTSFLEVDSVSPTTVLFNIILLVCCSVGLLVSVVLGLGIHLDRPKMLLPFIGSMTFEIGAEVLHISHLFALETVNFNPITAILFTMDFFLVFLNVYCVLCVTSQYQEYRAGRGTSEYDSIDEVRIVTYTGTQPTLSTPAATMTASYPASAAAAAAVGRARRSSLTSSLRQPQVTEPEKGLHCNETVVVKLSARTGTGVQKKHVQFHRQDSSSSDDRRSVSEREAPSLWMERELEPAATAAPPER